MQEQERKEDGLTTHNFDFSDTDTLMTHEITQEVIDCIKTRIISAVNPKKIIIFGSYATGTKHKFSDLDLLVVTDNPDSHRKLRRGLS